MENHDKDTDFIISDKGTYEPPPTGQHQGVLVDIIPEILDDLYNPGAKKKMFRFVFQLELENGERRADGSRYEISRLFSPSLNSGGEKYSASGLYTFTVQWFGKPIPEEERKDFDVRRLLAQNGLLNVIMNEKSKTVIGGIAQWSQRMGPKIQAENYKRREFKEPQAQQQITPQQSRAAFNAQAPVTDDSIPF